MPSVYRLRGMLPYLAAMFLNAFVDLGHKIVIQNTIFKIYDGHVQVVLTAIVNGLILLPYIALFSPAGFISDRFAKQRVMQVSAAVAVALTLAITVCYYRGWFELAFAMTLLLGVQAAIYSPAKYGYLKPLVGKERLAEGNGAVQAVTIVAILAGTFAFSIVFERWYDRGGATDPAAIIRAIAPLGWALVVCSACEFLLTLRLPALEQGDVGLHFEPRAYLRGQALRENLAPLRRERVIRLAIVGLAVFWAVSQVMVAAFPAFAKDSLGIHNTVVLQGILASSGIGIIIGSVLAGVSSKRHIETGLIPIGAVGITLGLLWLPALHSTFAQCLNFLFIGAMGGLFIVPLNALIQFHAREHEMGKVLAANNLIQNIAMLGFLVVTALVALAGLATHWLLTLIGLVALVGTGYTVLQLPQSLVRFVLTYTMTRRYRVQVQGFRHIPESGGVLLLGNHISWIDWAVVQIACPRPVRFVMLRSIYERWYLTGFFRLFGVIPISQGPGARDALDSVADCLRAGEVVCLFPEGTISRTGHLAEFRAGFERACAAVSDDVVIVPFYLRGLWGSQFSRASGRLRQARVAGLRRHIMVAFGPPLPRTTTADVLKRRILDLSIRAWQDYVADLPGLAEAWLEGARRCGHSLALADTAAQPFTGYQSLAAVSALARRLRGAGARVGILLPAGSGAALTNMAVLCSGRTVVNLDPEADPEQWQRVLAQTGIDTVCTVRSVLETLERQGSPLPALLQSRRVVCIRELLRGVSRAELFGRWLAVQVLPYSLLRALVVRRVDPEATAAIVYTSGSEGASRGVMLSHRNLLGNVRQIADVLNMQDDDVLFTALPPHHAFGLTATLLMPMIEGLPVVAHPQPDDALGCARAIAEQRATLLCGTPGMLPGYLQHPRVHPLMLQSLRAAVVGGEPLTAALRDAFTLQFQVPLLAGYGLTEATPVVSVNLPDQLDTRYWQVQLGGRAGTVGMPLPGSSCTVVDPDTLAELPTGSDGLLLIGGCQIMQGYLDDPVATAAAIVERDGVRWLRTGDCGHLDRDGFLTIRGRLARCIRRGGDWVALTEIEQALRTVLARTDLELVAVGLDTAGLDTAAAARVVVLIAGAVDAREVQHQLAAADLDARLLPEAIYLTAALPKLRSGEVDYAAAAREAAALA